MTHGHPHHRHITPQQAERIEADRRMLGRKVTARAEDRMRLTAREQLAQAQAELARGQDDAVPDADDTAVAGVLR